MSVSNVNGVGRVVLSSTQSRPAESPPPSRDAAGDASTTVTDVTEAPAAPRFPWLSRLTRELEPASKQPSPYGSVPVLGERLDRTA